MAAASHAKDNAARRFDALRHMGAAWRRSKQRTSPKKRWRPIGGIMCRGTYLGRGVEWGRTNVCVLRLVHVRMS